MEKNSQRYQKYDAELANKLMDMVGHQFYDQYHHLLDEHPEHVLELSIALCNLESRSKAAAAHVTDIVANINYAYQVSFALYWLFYGENHLDEALIAADLPEKYRNIILRNPEHAVELAKGIVSYYCWEKEEPLHESFLNFMLEQPQYADQFGHAVGKLYYIHRERLSAADKNEDINIIKQRERKLISDRFAMLMAQPESARVFTESIYYLEHWKYPLDLQKSLYRAGKYALKLLEGISILSRNNLLQYRKFLFDFPKHSVQLAYATIELLNHQLEYCMIYLSAYPEYAAQISEGLIELKKHGLSRYNDYILQHKDFADVLARAVVLMEEDEFLLQYKSEILHAPENAMSLVSGLQAVHKIGAERLIPILLANPESASSIGHGAEVLLKANLLESYEDFLPIMNFNLAETIVFLRRNRLKDFIQPLLKHPDCAYSLKSILKEYTHAAYLPMIQQIDNKEEAIQFFDYAFRRMHDVTCMMLSLHTDLESSWLVISSYMELWEKKSNLPFHTFFRLNYHESDEEEINENLRDVSNEFTRMSHVG